MKLKEVALKISALRMDYGVDLRIHNLDPGIIRQICEKYSLHMHGPEDHPLDFTFCKGWIKQNGDVSTSKVNAKCSFTLTSLDYEKSKMDNGG